MSEIQIILPLSALPEDTELTAEGIGRAMSDTVAAREAANHYRELYNSLIKQFQAGGRSLTLILDEVDDEWHRVQALRSFATEMKEMGESLREMP